MCLNTPDDYRLYEILRELSDAHKNETNGRPLSAMVGIYNRTKYALTYKTTDSYYGRAYTDLKHCFRNGVIPSKHNGAYLHINSKHFYGAAGYISVSVQTDAGNYVVCMGFWQDWSGNNSCGVEIRGCECSGYGNRNGVDANGNVIDMRALCSKKVFQVEQDDWSKDFEVCKKFTVECRFHNLDSSGFYFYFVPA